MVELVESVGIVKWEKWRNGEGGKRLNGEIENLTNC